MTHSERGREDHSITRLSQRLTVSVCLCTYVCVCVYVSVCVLCVCFLLVFRVCFWACICVCMCACPCVCMCVCTCVYVRVVRLTWRCNSTSGRRVQRSCSTNSTAPGS